MSFGKTKFIVFFLLLIAGYSATAAAETDNKTPKAGEQQKKTIRDFMASIPDPAATSDDFPIKKIQLMAEMAPLFNTLQKNTTPLDDEDIKKLKLAVIRTARTIFERMILLKRAEADGYKAETEGIEKQYSELIKNAASESDFLSNLNMSSAQLKKRIYDSLTIQEWLAKKINPMSEPNAAEIEEYYNTHREQFKIPETFDISNILIRFPAEKDKEKTIIEKLEKLSAEIKSEEDFKQNAAMISEDTQTKMNGGKLGNVALYEMPLSFADSVSKLKIGQTSQPFKSHAGWHIVRLNAKESGKYVPLKDIAADIKKALTRKKSDETVLNIIQDEEKKLNFRVNTNFSI